MGTWRGDRRGDRGLSPVVGGALGIVVVVLLGTVLASLAFGVAQEQPSPPEAALELEPLEGAPGYRLRHQSGGRIEGEQVALRGVAQPGVLDGHEFSAGDAVIVYPEREDLRLVWYADGNDSSYVIWRGTAGGSTYDVDVLCDWVEDRTSGGSDSITVDRTVRCDVVTDGSVTVDDGTVIGLVTSNDSQVTVRNGGWVYEDLTSDDAVDIDDGRVDGEVYSDDGGATLDNSAETGSVNVSGDVTVGTASTVDGDLTSRDGGVSLTGGSSVGGAVAADGSVDVDDVTVDGRVYSGDSGISLDNGAETGTINASGDVTAAATTIEGDVTSRDGSVSLTDTTVTGEVYVDGSFACTSSSINGQDCSEYTPNPA